MCQGSLGPAVSRGRTLPALASGPAIPDPLSPTVPPTVGGGRREISQKAWEKAHALCALFSEPGVPAASHPYSTCSFSSPCRPSPDVAPGRMNHLLPAATPLACVSTHKSQHGLQRHHSTNGAPCK